MMHTATFDVQILVERVRMFVGDYGSCYSPAPSCLQLRNLAFKGSRTGGGRSAVGGRGPGGAGNTSEAQWEEWQRMDAEAMSSS